MTSPKTTTPRPPHHPRRLAALALSLVLALAGCTSRSGATVDPLQVLRSRPTFEQAETDYLAMLDEMRTALSAAAPTLRWDKPRSEREGRAFCAKPFTDVPGTDSATYDGGWGKDNISDAVWPSVSQVVVDVAARHGFTKVIPLVDKPGNHVLDIYDDRGARVELGTKLGTTLTLYGGCFLTADAHPAPQTPTPPT